jgi:1-acyl-sn-glycerol-3-phosphate acyltransferase
MLYRITRALVKLILSVLADVEICGQEHVPPGGPLLVIINHLSVLDLPLMMVALPMEASVMAASKYQRGVTGFVLRRFNAIFVRRGTPDRRALRAALDVLKKGGVLGIAPEGTRSKTHRLLRGKPGVAFLALQADALILPAGVTGTERFLDDLCHFRRPKLRVVFGPPFRLEVPAKDRRDLQALTDEMMGHIAELLPAEYRGEYAEDTVT